MGTCQISPLVAVEGVNSASTRCQSCAWNGDTPSFSSILFFRNCLTHPKMEDPTAQDGDCLEYLLFSNVFSFLPCRVPFSARHLFPIPFSVWSSPVPVPIIPEMGRKSWASPLQRNWLESFLPMLSQAKETTSLETLYVQVYEAFLKKWDPEPIVPSLKEPLSPEELNERAKKRLKKVGV